MCNNILELAGNPYTIEIATDLHPDPTYQLQQDWLSKVIIKISSLLNKIDIGVRLLIASVLFVAAIFIGYNIGGAGLVCKLISDVIMGVGIGVVSYGAIAYLSAGKITSDGLAEAAVNAFLFASLFAFVYAGVNGIRYLCRSKPVSTVELAEGINNKTAVIGKMQHLKNYELQPGEYKLADLLQDLGNPKANWKQNSSVLRKVMQSGHPIKDISVMNGKLISNTGILSLEREIFSSHGWIFSNGYWILGG